MVTMVGVPARCCCCCACGAGGAAAGDEVEAPAPAPPAAGELPRDAMGATGLGCLAGSDALLAAGVALRKAWMEARTLAGKAACGGAVVAEGDGPLPPLLALPPFPPAAAAPAAGDALLDAALLPVPGARILLGKGAKAATAGTATGATTIRGDAAAAAAAAAAWAFGDTRLVAVTALPKPDQVAAEPVTLVRSPKGAAAAPAPAPTAARTAAGMRAVVGASALEVEKEEEEEPRAEEEAKPATGAPRKSSGLAGGTGICKKSKRKVGSTEVFRELGLPYVVISE
jgi:hypothetical protein